MKEISMVSLAKHYIVRSCPLLCVGWTADDVLPYQKNHWRLCKSVESVLSVWVTCLSLSN